MAWSLAADSPVNETLEFQVVIRVNSSFSHQGSVFLVGIAVLCLTIEVGLSPVGAWPV